MDRQNIYRNPVAQCHYCRSETAFAKLFTMYSEDIFNSLKRLYPNIAKTDDAIIMEAVQKAFLLSQESVDF